MGISEKFIIDDLSKEGKKLQPLLKGLTIGKWVTLLRTQLKMSQKILAKRAGVPQSTISNLEQSKKQPNLVTLQKVFHALCCDILIVPVLNEPVETILYKQAQKKAEQHIRYLQGSMNLEEQEPDANLIKELMKKEIEEQLRSSKLWDK